jgi:hypothetical protein
MGTRFSKVSLSKDLKSKNKRSKHNETQTRAFIDAFLARYIQQKRKKGRNRAIRRFAKAHHHGSLTRARRSKEKY